LGKYHHQSKAAFQNGRDAFCSSKVALWNSKAAYPQNSRATNHIHEKREEVISSLYDG
jgi:hypothetical protein